MAAIKQRNTVPERMVRTALHRMGYRYRLHAGDLPGCPDIVFRSKQKVIFVHGCFWDRHNCRRSTTPILRREYWLQKFRRTVARDLSSRQRLRQLGWKSFVVWECQINSATLKNRLETILRIPLNHLSLENQNRGRARDSLQLIH